MADDEDMSLLNSFRNYNHLNNDVYKWYIQNVDKCEELKVKLKEQLEKDYKGIDDFCTRLGGILYKLNDLRIVPLIDNDACAVVNYWKFFLYFGKNLLEKKNVLSIEHYKLKSILN
ncbi:PIR Superfamily Protein [Plasmodium ovale curtisi]|uniref:PIR Superfamily Protein n=1 Tax=Plasmodium ovale curtisi TaxID=864141 RepID=A0A1A8XB99_PLAOA|nr:PIR Superfamily Protein [Plasmodium ovale curtisi]